MSINFAAGAKVYKIMIQNFSKSLSYTPVTKSTDNLTGDETLTDGTPTTISGAFFPKEDNWSQDNPGLLQDADAVLMVLPTVTITKDSKITYNGDTYRIAKVKLREYAEVDYYKVARCFLI